MFIATCAFKPRPAAPVFGPAQQLLVNQSDGPVGSGCASWRLFAGDCLLFFTVAGSAAASIVPDPDGMDPLA